MNHTTIARALSALRNGEVIVYPTDTLYALGADVFNDIAIQKIFLIKKRPETLALPIAVGSISEIEKIGYLTPLAEIVANHFLPGPVTLLIQKKECISKKITGGRETVAVRIPNHPLALHLLSTFGPLTATSANIHAQETPQSTRDIQAQLHGDVAVFLDGGRLKGLPSTIVDVTTEKPVIVRQGVVSSEEIMAVVEHG
ncbi:MAG: L-threonylcarbamoyladenylate synthase [Candidatus Thermoplasmatota archaeon]